MKIPRVSETIEAKCYKLNGDTVHYKFLKHCLKTFNFFQGYSSAEERSSY